MSLREAAAWLLATVAIGAAAIVAAAAVAPGQLGAVCIATITGTAIMGMVLAAGQARHRATCNCLPGMRFHALNCPVAPGELRGERE